MDRKGSVQQLNLTDNKWLRIGVFCALYVAQGIPFGFVTIALAAHLSGRGVGEADLGSVIAMTSLPWSFKFLWGPLIDRFGVPSMGKRRPWILFAQTSMALTIAVMLFVSDLSAQLGLLTDCDRVPWCDVDRVRRGRGEVERSHAGGLDDLR